jgi:hypothetical protein
MSLSKSGNWEQGTVDDTALRADVFSAALDLSFPVPRSLFPLLGAPA